jgi:hypothetical protein
MQPASVQHNPLRHQSTEGGFQSMRASALPLPHFAGQALSGSTGTVDLGISFIPEREGPIP